MADITTTLGGLTFSTATEGVGFTIERLDGWHSGAPVRSVVEDRPNADGAFGVVRVYKGARVITQTGLILGDSQGGPLWTAFAGLQADGAPSLFGVDDSVRVLSAEVTLAGVPDLTQLIDGTARYVLSLIARDPVKYGPNVEYSTGLPTSGGGLEYPLHDPAGALYYGANGNPGRVELSNPGTAAIYPFVTVTGQLDAGFYIQCLETGERVRYDRVVPAGSFVTINFRTGEVLVDGVSDASTYLTVDEFFSVAPGGSCTVQFNAIGGASGSPTMTVTLPAGGWW